MLRKGTVMLMLKAMPEKLRLGAWVMRRMPPTMATRA